MTRYHLAQINIAELKAPLDSPELKDFVDNLDRINALGESSEGFVWRLKDEGNNATEILPFGENVIINMTVWRDVESLKRFTYQSAHTAIMKRRREWFTKMAQLHFVLWWIPRDHLPTVAEAAIKLEHLRKHGATAAAFTFGEAFSAPDAPQPGSPFSFLDTCPA